MATRRKKSKRGYHPQISINAGGNYGKDRRYRKKLRRMKKKSGVSDSLIARGLWQ